MLTDFKNLYKLNIFLEKTQSWFTDMFNYFTLYYSFHDEKYFRD